MCERFGEPQSGRKEAAATGEIGIEGRWQTIHGRVGSTVDNGLGSKLKKGVKTGRIRNTYTLFTIRQWAFTVLCVL